MRRCMPPTRAEEAGMSIDGYRPVRGQRGLCRRCRPLAEDIRCGPGRLNVNGGAIALGHPLGGSGTKLMTTCERAKQRNSATPADHVEGGGMANLTIVERL